MTSNPEPAPPTIPASNDDRDPRRLILAVDDDPRALKALADLLTIFGYRVITASTFEEARRLLDEQPPDLLITDLRLGSYNGLQLVIRDRLKRPEMPCIVLTGYDDPVLKADTEKHGAVFMVKPIDPPEFRAIVAKTLKIACVETPTILSGVSQTFAVGSAD